MNSIVLELQKEAQGSNVSVSSLLRKALVVASKLKVKEFEEWINNELNGYGDTDKIPEHPYKRYCTSCLRKREELNKIYEQQRKDRGICTQCGINPIDYLRSRLHCTSCLDLRNYNKLPKKRDDTKSLGRYVQSCP